ncbi:MAG: serpin family protein, partial [Myxococcota bacterium]
MKWEMNMMISSRLRTNLSAIATAALLVLACACDGGFGPGEDENGQDEMLRGDQALVRSDLPRAQPQLDPTELAAQVEANTAFGLDLYKELRLTEDDNLFLSPLSISLALGMTHAGARGATAEQMAQALRFVLADDGHHDAFNAIEQALASRGQGAQGSDGEGFRLNINNAVWGQEGFGLESPFLDLLATRYDAGLRLLDFAAQPEVSREIINEWVSFHTEEKIPELLPEGSINDYTRLVLTNTVYFNAAWKHPLDDDTRDAPFTMNDGQVVQVETMHKLAPFGYASLEGFEVVELPYDGDELSMVVLLPAEGELEALEEGLTVDALDAALAELETMEVDLALPKFSFSKQVMLPVYLQALGMLDAFDPGAADFTGISPAGDLYEVLVAQGLATVGLIALILNIWTTNDNAAYAFSVAGAEAFEFDRKRPFVIAGCFVGIGLALAGADG